jgi:hypothetical protein
VRVNGEIVGHLIKFMIFYIIIYREYLMAVIVYSKVKFFNAK